MSLCVVVLSWSVPPMTYSVTAVALTVLAATMSSSSSAVSDIFVSNGIADAKVLCSHCLV